MVRRAILCDAHKRSKKRRVGSIHIGAAMHHRRYARTQNYKCGLSSKKSAVIVGRLLALQNASIF
jgi:hypothetical protein